MGNLEEKLAMPTYNIEEEKELILKAQSGDKLAMKKLRMMYDGTIRDSIKRSGVNSQNIPEGALQNQALKAFRSGILNYSPTAGAKPNTFITSYIKNDLKNMETAYQNDTRIQSADAWSLKAIMGATKQLKGQGIDNPSVEEIQEKLKTEYDKDFNADYINTTLGKQRRELSGNVGIGEDGVGENLTFEELTDVSGKTVEDFLDEGDDKDKVNDLLSKLDDNERDLYEHINGVGKYEGVKPLKKGTIAQQKGFGSEYFAEKEIEKIKNKLRGDLK